MNIDLVSLYNRSQKINDLENKWDECRDINDIISMIIGGRECYTAHDKKLLDKIGFTYSKKQCKDMFGHKYTQYTAKLNKDNVKKLQEYLKKEDL